MFAGAEFAAEVAESVLFLGGEAGHEIGDLGGVMREDGGDEFAAGVGDFGANVAAVFGALDALHVSGFLEVIDDHSEVAAGAEDFLRQLGKAERANVVKSFKDGEL